MYLAIQNFHFPSPQENISAADQDRKLRSCLCLGDRFVSYEQTNQAISISLATATVTLAFAGLPESV
jgi:hypothetical protein